MTGYEDFSWWVFNHRPIVNIIQNSFFGLIGLFLFYQAVKEIKAHQKPKKPIKTKTKKRKK